MKTSIKIILILSLANPVFSQTSKTLSEELWERAKNCYSMFEDTDEDGKADYNEVIDDSKNGYLKVSGSWPTCGCGCTDIIGAYRSLDGSYTFLEEETWNCNWTNRISSNKELSSIFPENFGLNVFIPNTTIPVKDKAFFYMDVDIPRVGTDTKLTIKLIPFGIQIESKTGLSFEYAEKEGYSNCYYLYRIRDIVSEIRYTETLDLILNSQFEKISNHDIELINATIGDGDDSRFKSRDELKNRLKELKLIYDLYSLIEHESIILGWNKQEARFFIKEKGVHSKSVTFREFLLENEYWSPVC